MTKNTGRLKKVNRLPYILNRKVTGLLLEFSAKICGIDEASKKGKEKEQYQIIN